MQSLVQQGDNLKDHLPSLMRSLGNLAAVHVDRAGIDICLVGDSVGMVVHGHDTTLPVTMEDMLLHCKAVARGAHRPLLIGDLPFGSYEQSAQQVYTEAASMTLPILCQGSRVC